MSNEIKAVSFRVVEEDIQKFRVIAEQQGMNQAEMFKGLMNNYEMAKAKGQITDRAKEIEVFQDTVNNIVSMFINSLAINQTSEERIRETLSLELNTKDKTIADLQEHKEKMKSAAKVNDEKVVELDKIVKDITESLAKVTKELEQKNTIVDNQQDQINTLTALVTEYSEYKQTINIVKEELITSNREKEELIYAAKEHKLENTNLINNIEILKENINKNKNDLEQLKANNKENISQIKDDYKNTIEGKNKEIERIHKELDAKVIELNLAHKNNIDEIKANLKKEIDVANDRSTEKIEMNKEKLMLKYERLIFDKDKEIEALKNKKETNN